MKRLISIFILIAATAISFAQKPRPDAFPPAPDPDEPKGLAMAATIEEMRSWDRYPTYPVYVAMMEQFADSFPALCHLDTIGTTLEGRLLLSLAITGPTIAKENRPEFFYSSTMHGDEVAGFYLMLRLCDTLLRSYGTSPAITRLLDNTRICINPNANPDGTYHGGDTTIDRARRYNSNGIDLNRNYPDPFGTDPLDTIQRENQLMIDYVNQHHFLLSANLHGGSEVLNYPWDSFTARQRPNEHAEWWKQVCKRFIDTVRNTDSQRYRDVAYNGYIVGGDWYVISNGRQDYFNYYNGMREMTIEVSSTKKPANSKLNSYWNANAQALINYIDEIHAIDTSCADIPMHETARKPLRAYPNPTRGLTAVDTRWGKHLIDLTDKPTGIYLFIIDGQPVKVGKL